METPEQVALSFTVAGLGSRAAAAMWDLVICAVLLGGLWLALDLATRATTGAPLDPVRTPWSIALLLLGQFAVLWGYNVLWEGLRDGQTPGKRRFGLRVVRDSGLAVDFPASAARNLVRVIDLQPGFLFGVGLISAALSSRSKRLGDMVAGTIVVRERTLPVPVGDAPTGVSHGRLSASLRDDEYDVLSRLHERRHTITPSRLTGLNATLAGRLRGRAPDIAAQAPDDAGFLARLYESETAARARGIAALNETGARREQYALIAAGSPRWQEFGQLLERAQRRGLAALGEDGIGDFVARYRDLTTDLARLQTATRDRDVAAVYQVSRLVAAGHNLLYRGSRLDPWGFPRYLFRTVPAQIRRAWRPIMLAALLLFGPAAIAFVAVLRSPEVARQLVPRELMDRAETGVVREADGGGYLPEDQARLRGPVLTSAIATNNVRVTYITFASGITGGVLTVILLVSNGVSALGAPLGYYARLDILPQILGFVAGHGVLELAAICISGGAAFEMAAGMFLPGALTRREALVRRTRRALHLLAGTTFLLIIAGLIEGLISPLVWPLSWKLTLSGATAVLLAVWLTGGRPPRGAAPPPAAAHTADLALSSR